MATKTGSTLREQAAASLERANKLMDDIEAKRAGTLKTGAVPVSAPFARKGESALTSRGFQFTRLLGAIAGAISQDDAKVELMMAESIKKSHLANRIGVSPGYLSVPLGTSLMPEGIYGREQIVEYHQCLKAGVAGADPDEINWMMQKSITASTGMSYLDATTGGALVGPAQYGELIDLLRNKDAFMRAGADVQALPPTGVTFPRLTSPTVGTWLGEKEEANPQIPKTGVLELRPKKAMILALLPNELLRYGTVAGEAVARNDIAVSLSLTMDLAFFNGTGGKAPLGLLNTTGVATVTPSTVASDGNTLAPGDLLSFLAKVYENNADFTGYVMRPDLWLEFAKARASVYTGSGTSGLGQFLFDQNRLLESDFSERLAGKRLTLSNNVPKNRVKGSGTALTCVVGGNFPDFIIGMLGTIEFMTSNQGVQLMAQDMTAISGILTCDGGPRHPGAFAVADTLLTAVSA